MFVFDRGKIFILFANRLVPALSNLKRSLVKFPTSD